MARGVTKSDLERWSAEARLRSAPFLVKLSDRDDPWLRGYLKDMLYALAASNCNMGAKAADITYYELPDVYNTYYELSAGLTPL